MIFSFKTVTHFLLLILLLIIFYYILKYIFSRKSIHKFCYQIGISAISFQDMLFLTGSALIAGLIFHELNDLSKTLIYFSLTSLFFGIANILLNKQPVRRLISKIPFFGEYLTCPLATQEKVEKVKNEMKALGLDELEINATKRCTLTCENCRGTDAIKIIAGWTCGKLAFPWIMHYLKGLK